MASRRAFRARKRPEIDVNSSPRTVALVQETVLVGAGDRLTKVFFPHNGVISLVVSLAGGGMIEVASIGSVR